jgi:serine/threonine-protein kinase
MAPELASGNVDAVDARSDLWALGATMFQLLTGTTVHQVRSAQEAVVAAATRSAPPVKSRREDVPDVLAGVVDRALRFDSSERWPNARAMLAAIDAVAPHVDAGPQRSEGSTLDTLAEAALVQSRRRPPRARIAASIFGGVLVVVVTAFVVMARHARREVPAVRASAPKQLVAPSSPPAVTGMPVSSSPGAAPAEPAEEPTSAPSSAAPSQKPRSRRVVGKVPSTEPPPAADALLDRRK